MLYNLNEIYFISSVILHSEGWFQPHAIAPHISFSQPQYFWNKEILSDSTFNALKHILMEL